MEAELKTHYPDSDIALVEGSGGIFDVTCDGRLIYCKKKAETNRFPHEGEVAKLIKDTLK